MRMTTMVDSLRATADPHSVRLKPTDINMLIIQTLELQRPLIEEAGIRLELELDVGLPTTEADPLRLQQVFVNLINNARQAIEASPGSGQLAIGTQLVHAGDSTPNIQVRFSDNGPGIPSDVMPHIFEPFYTTKTGNGMGLGLPICQQILEKHRGRIWAEENFPSGAILVLELPVVEVCPGKGNESADPSGGRLPHILVVDDEPEVALYVGEFLEQEGFTVTTTTGARKALTLTREDRGRSDHLRPEHAADGRQAVLAKSARKQTGPGTPHHLFDRRQQRQEVARFSPVQRLCLDREAIRARGTAPPYWREAPVGTRPYP